MTSDDEEIELQRKAVDDAAEQIAAWLEEHAEDDGEFDYIDASCISPTKLAAAIREGRWRK